MMKILINIGVAFLLLFWPMVLFTSVMMFDAPGSTENLSIIISVILVVAYPIYIFSIYHFLNAKFFGLSALLCLKIVTVIVLLAMSVFGYFTLLWEAVVK
ncbi:MAG: hypothetical protein RLO12_10385 [Fulvivirga sp.]|uniref:hypothetical protein n=1 Tax=Fulvivirga sp. TaxID=1931237 RepID=UPI003304DC7A